MNHYFHLLMGETESPEEEVICHIASQWQSQEQKNKFLHFLRGALMTLTQFTALTQSSL